MHSSVLIFRLAFAEFEDIVGTCERILRAPIPLSYTRHTSRFMVSFFNVRSLIFCAVAAALHPPHRPLHGDVMCLFYLTCIQSAFFRAAAAASHPPHQPLHGEFV